MNWDEQAPFGRNVLFQHREPLHLAGVNCHTVPDLGSGTLVTMNRLGHVALINRPVAVWSLGHSRQYRTYPRGRYLYRRSLGYVNLGLGQPPNYKGEHHFFLPSINEHLKETEEIRNPCQINTIGITEEQFLTRILGSEPRKLSRGEKKRAKIKLQAQDIKNPDDLLANLAEGKKAIEIDYPSLLKSWHFSKDGREQIMRLAHHYQIYRDLFSSPSLVPTETPSKEPQVKIPILNPHIDHILTDFFKDWYPGYLRHKPPVPRDIYEFVPHVPLYVEFGISEEKLAAEDKEEWDSVKENEKSKPNPEALITSPVYRGNLIRPIYSSEKPTVIIDASGGDGNSTKSYFDLANDCQGKIKLITPTTCKDKFTLLLLNLDTILGDDLPVCHWAVSNISNSEAGNEVIPFLPVFGINGLGYHRFVFLLLLHEKDIQLSQLTGYDLHERKLNLMNLLKEQSVHPVGLSWFQSVWDDWSNKVMYDTLKARAPQYEYIEEEYQKVEQVKYPYAAPFNLYLDHFRDSKEINQEVLLERLKKVNPFDYSKEFDIDPIPNAYGELRDLPIPSWQQSTVWKKRNRLGPWRLLRPASAKIPLNNNADLDRPFWPHGAKQFLPLKYPKPFIHPKPLRETKWVIPPQDHPHLRIDHEDTTEVNRKIEKDFDES